MLMKLAPCHAGTGGEPNVAEKEQRGDRDEGFSIPIDWSISIDDEGRATVDDAPGRITAESDSKQGSIPGQGRLPQLPSADKKGKQDGGEPISPHRAHDIDLLHMSIVKGAAQ